MTSRLLGMAQDLWTDIDGYGVAHGFDPAELSLSRLSNFMWWFTTRNAEQKEIDKFKARLWRPPPGHVVEHEDSPWAPDKENDAFAALKSSLGGKVSSS